MSEAQKDKTLPAYLNRIKDVYGLLAGAIPLLPSGFSDAGRFFPVLGDQTDPARLFVILFSAALVFITFWLTQPQQMVRYFIKLLGASIGFFILYLLFLSFFIVRIDMPANKSSFYLSIGFKKTAEAVRRFGTSESAAEMIKNTGVTDNDLEEVWTKWSIYVARVCLVLTYLGVTSSLVLLFSSGVRYAAYKKDDQPM